jgi:hypothetical protein
MSDEATGGESGAESAEGSQPSAQAAPPGGEQTKPETPAQERARIRLQWEGKEEEVDDATYVDRIREVLGDEGLRNVGQLGKLARTKVSKLGERERVLKQAEEDLRDEERALALLERIHGKDKIRARFEEWYARDLDDRKLTPEQREARGLKSELEQLRAEKAKIEREREERAIAQQVSKLQPQFGRDFTNALASTGLDKGMVDAEMLADMAKYVEGELGDIRSEADYRAVLAEAARAVSRKHVQSVAQRAPKLPKESRAAVLREALKGMSPAEVAELLGEEGVRAFRKHDIERTKSKQGGGAPPASAPAPRQSNGQFEKKHRNIDDFFAEIRKGDRI